MNLSGREKIIVALGGFVIALTILWLGVYDPVSAKLDQMDKKIVSQGKRYLEMQRISKNYKVLKDSVEATEKRLVRAKGFSILSHLENLAVNTQVKDRIVQMKPKQGQATRYYKESLVEIKMEKVMLETLVNYLYQVENSPELLRLKDMKIKPRFDNKNLVDAIFTVSAYEPGEVAQ